MSLQTAESDKAHNSHNAFFSLTGHSITSQPAAPSVSFKEMPKFQFHGFKNSEEKEQHQQETTEAPVLQSFQFGTTGGISHTMPKKIETMKKRKNNIYSKAEKPNATAAIFPTDFESLRKEHVRPLIELNDRVNALTSSETQINSTRIVVAGDQSHGKTSLLEALSGVDLPRGEGIVTRVPLILQLRGCNNENEEGATIKHTDEGAQEVHIPIGLISQQIVEFTNVAAGSGKNVKNKPIELKIFRKGQDDLTLIDLPGITRVALDDQAGGNDKKLEALIMGMCREYMEPKESILLNVVNAMVDFTTSASLALSRELDPTGSRTMLCITKVDQYREDGFHDKVSKAIHTMKLNPDHVFCVRNRSQKENDDSLPLEQVRAEEMKLLEEMTDGRAVEYHLGVQALSKTLVKKQCNEIVSILPATQKKIKTLFDTLNSELNCLYKPVGDIGACRGKAMELVDACVTRLQNELSGQVFEGNIVDGTTSCENEAFELCIDLKDVKGWLEKEGTIKNNSAKTKYRECSFDIEVVKKEENVGAYLNVEKIKDSVDQVDVDCTFVGFLDGEEIEQHSFNHKLDLSTETSTGRGYKSFVSTSSGKFEDAENLRITASVFVNKVIMKDKQSQEDTGGRNVMFCSKLVDLHESFTSDVDRLYSNHFFFSAGFRKSLAKEVEASRGGNGLPGAIATHISSVVLRKLQKKLPGPIHVFRKRVFEECTKTVELVIHEHVDGRVFPRLHHLLLDKSRQLLEDRLKILEMYHEKIIEWESIIASTNHYFMDTVQSIRSKIFKEHNEESEDEGENSVESYLKHLTPAIIVKMSNEEQKLIDEQIEIFAYWKVMKKRLVDYIILSTQSEIVTIPINQELKQAFLNAVFNQKSDDDFIKLLSPDDKVVRKRASLEERLKKLKEALDEIDAFQSKYIGGIVEL